ncbi:MAG: hypothetical protein M1114_01640 [Candidatus Dependentiae bacterium]|nr:hypothetical protein [Candidatus Dependentiae bacterium]
MKLVSLFFIKIIILYFPFLTNVASECNSKKEKIRSVLVRLAKNESGRKAIRELLNSTKDTEFIFSKQSKKILRANNLIVKTRFCIPRNVSTYTIACDLLDKESIVLFVEGKSSQESEDTDSIYLHSLDG